MQKKSNVPILFITFDFFIFLYLYMSYLGEIYTKIDRRIGKKGRLPITSPLKLSYI